MSDATSPSGIHIPPTTRTVVILGLSQLMCWGISYYLIGVFGERMAADLGQSRPVIYAGFSWALVVMGGASPLVGRSIDRWGGRPAMTIGAVLTAAGCLLLAFAEGLILYFVAWTVLGLAMRATLYDAAFATMARLFGGRARRPMSQITLLGGLASTAFWPLGLVLMEWWGWRGAVLVYAAIAGAIVVPLHLLLPRAPTAVASSPEVAPGFATATAQDTEGPGLAGFLYALVTALVAFLASAMSAHMIGLLTGLGVGASLAVALSALRGVGQSAARLAEVLFGARVHPLALGVFALGCLPLGFLAAGLTAFSTLAGGAFALLYGTGNGLATIIRGTIPLALFGSAGYGQTVGRLVAPSFALSALAPLLFALVLEEGGSIAGILLAGSVSLVALAAILVLFHRHRPRAGSGRLALGTARAYVWNLQERWIS
ncbi:MAG: MFS transporter [Alphaproteobacteria bacterium]|nr:MFS transporter [Alphaproteobacteria bacterium]